MACEKNGSQVSHSAGKLAGINATASKLGNIWGNTSARMARISDTVIENIGSRIAPVSNRALKLINLADRPSALAIKALPFIPLAHAITRCVEVKSTMVGPKQGYEPAVFIALKLNASVKTAGSSVTPVVYGSPGSSAGSLGFFGTTNVWAVVGDLMKTEKQLFKILGAAKLASNVMANLAILTEDLEGSRILVKRGGPVKEVKFSKTKLTKLLNKQDRLFSKPIFHTEGELVTYKKRGQVYAWHRGSTIVQIRNPRTGDGEERVITHLQSIAVPTTSYYFDRLLSDQEVADVVSGQGKIRPDQLDGYVGSVSAIENLTPVWASTKRSLILTRLHWPSNERTPWALRKQAEWTLDEIIARQKYKKTRTAIMRDAASNLQTVTVEGQSVNPGRSQPPNPLIITQISQPEDVSEVASS